MKVRILLIEDSDGVKRSIAKLLESIHTPNCELTSFDNLEDGIEWLEQTTTLIQNRPQLVILDLALPHRDPGHPNHTPLETIALYPWATAPMTVVLSGYETKDVVNAAISAGAKEFISKADLFHTNTWRTVTTVLRLVGDEDFHRDMARVKEIEETLMRHAQSS